MKTMRTMWSLLFLAAMMFTACKHKDKHQDPPSITVDNAAITHALTAGTESVTITSNIDWTLSVPSTATWLQVVKKSGSKGTTKVTLAFLENKAPQPLVTDLTLSGSGVQDQKIHVVQNGTAAYINVDKNPIVIKPADVTDSFVVTTNTDWKLDVPSTATWLTVDRTTGSVGTTKVHFTMLVNTSIDTLRAELSLSSPSESSLPPLKVKVQHDGEKANLSVDKIALTEKAAGQQDSIVVTSNTSWSLSIPTSVTWVTADKNFGSAGSTKVFFTVNANSGTAVRNADITVSSTVSDVAPMKVSMSQKAVDQIINFIPNTGYAGTDVTISGVFNTTSTPIVSINGVQAIVKSYTTSSITFTIPSWTHSGKISISYGTVSLISSSDIIINTLVWNQAIGGTQDDQGSLTAVASDGGYVIVGSTNSNDGSVIGNHGGYDILIVKYDINGNLVWKKTFGGGSNDYAYSVKSTSDGGFILTGSSASFNGDVTVSEAHGSDDVWVVKLDVNGNIMWQHLFGGSTFDVGQSIEETSDGGYIVAGYTYSSNGTVSATQGGGDAWVMKLSSSGSLLWEHTYGGTKFDEANSIIVSPDGGYIIAGLTQSNDGDVIGYRGGYSDAWVLKLNESGTIIWQRSLGGSNDDQGNSVIATTDGSYLLAGWTYSNDGDVTGKHGAHDYWAVKLNASGGIVWQRTLGGSYSEKAQSVVNTSDGGYILAGSTYSQDGDVSSNFSGENAWVTYLDANGNYKWQKVLGGSGNDHANAIMASSDGSYIITGYTSSSDGDVSGNHPGNDIWIIKLKL
ncbi:MAG TPA: BACON domain-containing carbohydrate-binding protein [Flavisolibacter sp.]|nr:BACON domain-containing carbohydrate-binding protein [Flavisolibacter sp.]